MTDPCGGIGMRGGQVRAVVLSCLVLMACDDDGDTFGDGSAAPWGDGSAGAPDGPASTGDGGWVGDGPRGDGGAIAPSCVPRAGVPNPVPRAVSVAATCPAPAACGGAVEDTQWEVATACFDSDAWATTIRSVCSAVSLGSALPARPVGTATFAGGNANIQVSGGVTLQASFPNACHGCRCTDLQARLRSAGVDATCSPQCLGGACSCFLAKTFTVAAAGAYVVNDKALEITASQARPFCVNGDVLTLQDASGSVLTLRPPAALRTPEICDGIDNDGNGVIDDDPVECPSCSNVGACGAGVKAECRGQSGWHCSYTSPDWEPVETKCDGVDNDCDGEVNEGLGCREVCDGRDNDGVGGVDDNPQGAPACTRLGVCAGGNAPMCGGAAGWACKVASPQFEAAETACDGVDNDCDGLEDEVCCASTDARMYFAYIDPARSGSFVARARLDGTQLQNVVTLPLATLLDVSVDPIGKKIYWANLNASAIQRSNLDGSGVETIFPAGAQPRLTLDVGHRWLFWKGDSGIERVSLDDLTQRFPVPAGVSPLTMTVDTQHGWLYLGDGGSVTRVAFDGSGKIAVSDLPTVGQVIEGLSVDPVGKRVYWASAGGIHSANPDLTDVKRVLTLSYPHHVFVDAAARRLYWSETVSKAIGTVAIGETMPVYIKPEGSSVRFGVVQTCP